MATSATSGQMTTTDWQSVRDLLSPEKSNKLFRAYGLQHKGALGIIRSMANEEMVSNHKFSAYQDDYYHESIVVRANVAAPGAGLPSLITLDASKLDATNQFYPKKGHVITFTNEVQGIITAIDVTTPSAPVLTVQPLDALDNIGALTAGDELAITGSAYGQGTPGAEPSRSGYMEFDFYTQIFKDAIKTDGSALTNKSWFNVLDDNKQLKGTWTLEQLQLEYRLAVQEDGALLYGKNNTNPNVFGTSKGGQNTALYTTKGLVPTIRERGNPLDYSVGTGISLLDFDEYSLKLQHSGSTAEYAVMLTGMKLHQGIENLLLDTNYNTGVDFTKMARDVFNGNEALAFDASFSQLRKGGVTFLVSRLDTFSNPKTFGIDGYKQEETGIIYPLGSMKDAKTGKKCPNITSMYKGMGDMSRKYKMYALNGPTGSPVPITTDADELYIGVQAEHGLRIMGAEQMILVNPTA